MSTSQSTSTGADPSPSPSPSRPHRSHPSPKGLLFDLWCYVLSFLPYEELRRTSQLPEFTPCKKRPQVWSQFPLFGYPVGILLYEETLSPSLSPRPFYTLDFIQLLPLSFYAKSNHLCILRPQMRKIPPDDYRHVISMASITENITLHSLLHPPLPLISLLFSNVSQLEFSSNQRHDIPFVTFYDILSQCKNIKKLTIGSFLWLYPNENEENDQQVLFVKQYDAESEELLTDVKEDDVNDRLSLLPSFSSPTLSSNLEDITHLHLKSGDVKEHLRYALNPMKYKNVFLSDKGKSAELILQCPKVKNLEIELMWARKDSMEKYVNLMRRVMMGEKENKQRHWHDQSKISTDPSSSSLSLCSHTELRTVKFRFDHSYFPLTEYYIQNTKKHNEDNGNNGDVEEKYEAQSASQIHSDDSPGIRHLSFEFSHCGSTDNHFYSPDNQSPTDITPFTVLLRNPIFSQNLLSLSFTMDSTTLNITPNKIFSSLKFTSQLRTFHFSLTSSSTMDDVSRGGFTDQDVTNDMVRGLSDLLHLTALTLVGFRSKYQCDEMIKYLTHDVHHVVNLVDLEFGLYHNECGKHMTMSIADLSVFQNLQMVRLGMMNVTVPISLDQKDLDSSKRRFPPHLFSLNIWGESYDLPKVSAIIHYVSHFPSLRRFGYGCRFRTNGKAMDERQEHWETQIENEKQNGRFAALRKGKLFHEAEKMEKVRA